MESVVEEVMFLADIGNTHCHIFDGERVEHLLHEDALKKYGDRAFSYISVNSALENQIISRTQWKNISEEMRLEGAYVTMGVDRRALCLSHSDGIFVDAGSAITVDMMEGGKYLGGFIYPGLKAMLNAYATISPALKTEFNRSITLSKIPATTKDGISYGIIAPIKALIESHSKGKQLYFTGGDGKFLAHFFDNAIYDETLVFRGMQKVIKG
ncbi:MAG: hypothetical protein RL113_960 [Pseudomonadota bacterium]